ncbi:MAG: YqgE/AlgH family protein [Saprospiraceae bacterium]|nr:YqgE/AlgH family protein [Saprospiraceae bacterium]
MSTQTVEKGTVLLAEPFSLDTNFRRTAVVLTEHQDEGTVGFIMNRKMDVELTDLLSDFPELNADVFFGGPVATDSLHYLHNVGDLLEGSIKIKNGVYWGGDFDKLKFLIDAKLITPQNIRFYIGYSGWSSGQLEEELKYGSWVLADMHANYLFKSRPELLWEQIMTNKGNVFSVIAKMPDTVNWN